MYSKLKTEPITTEKERNIRLLLLLQDLLNDDNQYYIDFIKTMVLNDTPAIQKGFEIMTENYYKTKQDAVDNR